MIARSFILLTFFSLVSASGSSAQSFGVPNTGNAPPTGSPIEIEDCKTGQTGGMLLAESDGNFDVEFTNEGNTTADLIRFEIDLGQERLFIRDAGKFSPGVTIKHRFRQRGGNFVSSPLFSPAAFHCSVAAVHFVDGTDGRQTLPPRPFRKSMRADGSAWR